MYLHLGQNEIIYERRVIGIFDLDKCSYEKRTRDYLAAAEMIKSGKIDADKIVTHKFKIDEFQKAYEVCVSGAGLKVVIEP